MSFPQGSWLLSNRVRSYLGKARNRATASPHCNKPVEEVWTSGMNVSWTPTLGGISGVYKWV